MTKLKYWNDILESIKTQLSDWNYTEDGDDSNITSKDDHYCLSFELHNKELTTEGIVADLHLWFNLSGPQIVDRFDDVIKHKKQIDRIVVALKALKGVKRVRIRTSEEVDRTLKDLDSGGYVREEKDGSLMMHIKEGESYPISQETIDVLDDFDFIESLKVCRVWRKAE